MKSTIKKVALSQILASVRNDMPSMDNQGYIDQSRVIKKVMWCNDKLGIRLQDKKECIIEVKDYKAQLPLDFSKVAFVCALSANSFGIDNFRNPFHNTVTIDMQNRAKAEQCACPVTLGCELVYPDKIIRRCTENITQTYTQWIPLKLSKFSDPHVHHMCLNKGGKYTIDIQEELIELPFREGELYIMYFSNLLTEDGEVQVPFHPMISDWYEWCIKEKIFQDILMDSDAGPAVVNRLKYATDQKNRAWLDAVGFVDAPYYKELQQIQRRKEREFFNTYIAPIKG